LFRDFKKCFTHISIYEAKNDLKNPGNSRYVFLGMYAFKGYLAELIGKYIGGNGKQLQHYLGNVFSNDRLAHIFDEFELKHCVTLHPNLDSEKLKHVFAHALLGFIYLHATSAAKQAFAFRYFLNDSAHLLPKTHRLNEVHILKAKAQQVLNERIALQHHKINSDGIVLYNTKVFLTSGQQIGEHQSISETYARKKAVKNALKHLLNLEAQTPEYQQLMAKKTIAENEKIARQKAEKQKEHKARMEEKQKERAILKQQKRKEAQEREIARLLNKRNNKKRKETTPTDKNKILEALKDPNLTPSKRRFLEDKLK
jgi:hypothetical protein